MDWNLCFMKSKNAANDIENMKKKCNYVIHLSVYVIT